MADKTPPESPNPSGPTGSTGMGAGMDALSKLGGTVSPGSGKTPAQQALERLGGGKHSDIASDIAKGAAAGGALGAGVAVVKNKKTRKLIMGAIATIMAAVVAVFMLLTSGITNGSGTSGTAQSASEDAESSQQAIAAGLTDQERMLMENAGNEYNVPWELIGATYLAQKVNAGAAGTDDSTSDDSTSDDSSQAASGSSQSDPNLPDILKHIRFCESSGNYESQNSSTSASGAFQFEDPTWASMPGTKGYAHAKDAPASIQDHAAEALYKQQGGSPWLASKPCWGNYKGPANYALTNTGGLKGGSSTSSASASAQPSASASPSSGATSGDAAGTSTSNGSNGRSAWTFEQSQGTTASIEAAKKSGDRWRLLMEVAKYCQKAGWTLSENPLFGGVTPGGPPLSHEAGSLHYYGQAIDINIGGAGDDDPTEVAAAAKLMPILRSSTIGWIWQSPGHKNHVHLDTGAYYSYNPQHPDQWNEQPDCAKGMVPKVSGSVISYSPSNQVQYGQAPACANEPGDVGTSSADTANGGAGASNGSTAASNPDYISPFLIPKASVETRRQKTVDTSIAASIEWIAENLSKNTKDGANRDMTTGLTTSPNGANAAITATASANASGTSSTSSSASSTSGTSSTSSSASSTSGTSSTSSTGSATAGASGTAAVGGSSVQGYGVTYDLKTDSASQQAAQDVQKTWTDALVKLKLENVDDSTAGTIYQTALAWVEGKSAPASTSPATDSTGGIGMGAGLNGKVPQQYVKAIEATAKRCKYLSAPLIAGEIMAESGWNPKAVSPAGAIGIAQFMPGTWADMQKQGKSHWDENGNPLPGNGSMTNPYDEIGAMSVLLCEDASELQRLHVGGDMENDIFASYNAGTGAIEKVNGDISRLTPETQQYYSRILNYAKEYSDGKGGVTSDSGSLTGAAGSALAEKAAQLSLTKIGLPYTNDRPEPGGLPNINVAADCSGLVMWAYWEASGEKKYLPSRTATMINDTQQLVDVPMSNDHDLSQAKVGDLILFNGIPGDQPWGHVGMYIGGGKIMEERTYGLLAGVSDLSTSYWQRLEWKVRRVK